VAASDGVSSSLAFRASRPTALDDVHSRGQRQYVQRKIELLQKLSFWKEVVDGARDFDPLDQSRNARRSLRKSVGGHRCRTGQKKSVSHLRDSD